MSHSQSGSSLTKQPQVFVPSPKGAVLQREILFLAPLHSLSALLMLDPQTAAITMRILSYATS